MLRALFRDRNAALDADVYALTILTAVKRESQARLTAYLRGLKGDVSPFRKLRTTHFARLVVIDSLAGRPEHDQPRLLFSAVIDGTSKRARDAYLRELCTRLPGVVEQIWGACEGAPE